MTIQRFKNLKDMYIGSSVGGALKEGRKDKHYGNTMLPSAMVRYAVFDSFTQSPVTIDWAPGRRLTQYNYKLEIKTFLPLDTLIKGSDILSSTKRLETISYWHASFQEIMRHLYLAQTVQSTEIWDALTAIAGDYSHEIREAFHGYANDIVNLGDFSYEQYEFYVTEHKDSASPFDILNAKGEINRLKWDSILQNEKYMKYTYTVMLKIPQEYANTQQYFDKHEYLLIDADYAYAALRARQGDYKIIDVSNNIVIAAVAKIRDRKAGGIKKLSQLEWPIYKKTELKRKIYHKNFYTLIEKIAGAKLHNITMLGASFYYEVIQNGQKLFAYDLRNAEKLIALLFPWMHFNADLGLPWYEHQLSGEVYSGVGPTRILAELAVAIIIKYLKSVGYEIDEYWGGGDNFAFKLFIDATAAGLDIIFTNEESILGLWIEHKSFGPPSLITDNTNNRVNLPREFKKIQWVQTQQHETRILQYVVQNSLFKESSCETYLKWVIENDLDQIAEIYDKVTLNQAISYHIKDKFLDKFSDELNFIKRYFPINNDLKTSTDAEVIIL